MNTKKLLATMLLAGILVTGCGVKKDVIIKINDSVVTKQEFEKLMDSQIAQSPFAQMGMAEGMKEHKDGMLYLMTEQGVINQIIVKELLEQEVKAKGIKVSNKEVDKAIAKIMDQMGGKDKLSEILKQNGVSVSKFREDIKMQVKMQKLARLSGKTKVSDAEVKDFYNKNIQMFKHGEQVKASHILLMANPYQIEQELVESTKKELKPEEKKALVQEQMDKQKALAQKLSKELQADNSKFAQYAQKYSDDKGSASNGGDLGFFDKEQMVPEFSKVAFSAKPNTVSEPVHSQFGYHIIMVTDRRAAGTEPLEKIQSKLKERLAADKELKTLDDIVNAAKKKAKIEFVDEQYNPDVIAKKLKEQIGEMQKQSAEMNKQKK